MWAKVAPIKSLMHTTLKAPLTTEPFSLHQTGSNFVQQAEQTIDRF